MKEKFIVKNNSGNVLMLPKNRITFTVSGRMDLVDRLDKPIDEIKNDSEIKEYISSGKLLIVEMDGGKSSEIENKLDFLIGLVEKKDNKKEEEINVFNMEVIDKIIKEEINRLSKNILSVKVEKNNNYENDENINEELKEKFLKEIVSKNKVKDSNIIIKNQEEIKIDPEDDHSNLIDF